MAVMTIDIEVLRDLLAGQDFANPFGAAAALDTVRQHLGQGGLVLATNRAVPTHFVALHGGGRLSVESLPGYMPGPVKHAEDGAPMYLYVAENGALRWVVQRNGHATFSDVNGQELAHETTPGGAAVGGAVLGALLGLAFGGAGVLVGAAVGAALGGVGEKARRG